MNVLLVADDLTGTFDGAVPFAPYGVHVLTRCRGGEDLCGLEPEAPVLAVNAETRHLDMEESARRVREIVRWGIEHGARVVVKKTDSALRGNIGAELEGMIQGAGGGCVHFIPAFPRMGRVTRDGVQYVDGVPVAQTVFGDDPFEPVTESRVSTIVSSQASAVDIFEVGLDDVERIGSEGIAVYDALSEDDVRLRCDAVLKHSHCALLAGCAGLSSALAQILFEAGTGPATLDVQLDSFDPNMLVMCGSVNRVSADQCAYACEHGAPAPELPLDAKLDPGWVDTEEAASFIEQTVQTWSSSPVTVLDNSERFTRELIEGSGRVWDVEAIRSAVASCLGSVTARLVRAKGNCTVLVMGGDILQTFLMHMGIVELSIIGEPLTGVVMSEFTSNGAVVRVISKSGGFGSPDLFISLQEKLAKQAGKGVSV